jgi:polysaccharide biosynthesis/export protein VpsN
MSFARCTLPQFLIMLFLQGCAVFQEPAATAEERAPSPAEQAATARAEDYRLGAGDIISIRVYDWRMSNSPTPGEEDLKIDRIRLDQTGTINLPFGEFKAGGRTVKELETALIASLKGRLLRNPRLLINMDEYRPFFVEGQVVRAGAYPYQPGLNVRKAVTIGGGFKERASFEKIFVVREGDKSNRRVRVNLNSPVGPGDTVTVEESFF